MRPIQSSFALLLATAAVLAPNTRAGDEKTDADRIISLEREDSRVQDHLDFLVNRIGPRLTSSDGLQTACEWARDQFKSFGIENARLEKWGEFPVGFNRGPWFGRIIEPTEKALVFGTNSWTAGTKGKVQGKAILAPTNDDELAAVKDQLKGAFVLLPPGTPGPRNPQQPPANAPTSFREKLQSALDEAGIAGTIRAAARDLIVTGGAFRADYDKLPTIPAINLVKSQFDEITAILKEGKPVTLEFDIRNYFKRGPIPLYNVIADITGSEFPDQYVIFGGHIDSWDGATGTTDNGTGCATTLEAARLLMKTGVKPRRTIRFMLWSGEEQGLLGSRAYVQANKDLMPKISAVFVHDGGTNYLSGLGVTKAMMADLEPIFAPLAQLDSEMPFRLREVPGLRAGGGSDHASFFSAGVPGFFWGQAGKANYTTTHHTQHDTFDRAVPEYQKHSSIVVALTALGIANLDHLLSREGMNAPAGAPGGPGGNRRLLGIQLEDLTIAEVIEDGVAAKAGLKAGDSILKLGDKPVGSVEEFMELMRAPEAPKSITVKRDGKELEIKLDFPARPMP